MVFQTRIDESAGRATLVSSKASSTRQALDYAVSTAHYTEQVLAGDVVAASLEVAGLKAKLIDGQTRHTELSKACGHVQSAHSIGDEETKVLVADLACFDSESEALRSDALMQNQGHVQLLETLKQDYDALRDAQTAILVELTGVEDATNQTKDETRVSLEALRQTQVSEQEGHDQASDAISKDITVNDARILALRGSCESERRELDGKKAELDSRWREYSKGSKEYDDTLTTIMYLGQESLLDLPQYEPMWKAAEFRQKRAEAQAAAAEMKAAEAVNKCVEMAKEMAVSKSAFNMQLKDLRAENVSLSEVNSHLAVNVEKVRTDRAMYEEVIARLEKAFENHRHPYVHRIRCAGESLDILSMNEADQIAHLDTDLAQLHEDETRLAAQNAEYKKSIENVSSELDLIAQMQLETADAKWAAEGQAKALEQLILTPESGAVDTPTFSSSLTPSSPSVLITPELKGADDKADMLFDASFEEAESEGIANSATVRDLGEMYVRTSQLGTGLGLNV